MKILYHHRTLGDGAEGIHVASMVEAFQALGHDVRITAVIGERTNTPTVRTRLLKQVTRWTPRPAYEVLELGYSFVGRRQLASDVRNDRPDLIYERYMLFNTSGIDVARRFRIPLFLEVNAPLAWERAHYERLSLKRIARRYERSVCSRADRVLVVSTPLKEYLVSEGVPDERIRVLPNGADPLRFRPMPHERERVRALLGLSSDDIVIGFSGILRPWHGADLLIDAVAALPPSLRAQMKVLIVGDGPSRAALAELSRKHGMEQLVLFTGRVPHAQVPEYLAAFDLGVSPRATFYASPMKIPEYMAMGIPVVAPRMPNVMDLIDDRRTGVLFEPENSEALASALSTAAEYSIRTQLAHAARVEILERRSWRHVAERALNQ